MTIPQRCCDLCTYRRCPQGAGADFGCKRPPVSGCPNIETKNLDLTDLSMQSKADPHRTTSNSQKAVEKQNLKQMEVGDQRTHALFGSQLHAGQTTRPASISTSSTTSGPSPGGRRRNRRLRAPHKTLDVFPREKHGTIGWVPPKGPGTLGALRHFRGCITPVS